MSCCTLEPVRTYLTAIVYVAAGFVMVRDYDAILAAHIRAVTTITIISIVVAAAVGYLKARGQILGVELDRGRLVVEASGEAVQIVLAQQHKKHGPIAITIPITIITVVVVVVAVLARQSGIIYDEFVAVVVAVIGCVCVRCVLKYNV